LLLQRSAGGRNSRNGIFTNDVLTIDYDALVQSPNAPLKTIVHYLGLEWDENMLRHETILKDEERPGASLTARPIDKKSLKKWQTILSETDRDIVARYSHTDPHIKTA